MLLESKAVDYDYQFYKLAMPAEVVVTILSQGKALLQQYCDIVLPLHSLAAPGTLLACINACLHVCCRLTDSCSLLDAGILR